MTAVEYSGRDEVLDECVECFTAALGANSRSTRVIQLNMASCNSSEASASVTRYVILSAVGCVRLEINKLSACQLLDKRHVLNGRQTLYQPRKQWMTQPHLGLSTNWRYYSLIFRREDHL